MRLILNLFVLVLSISIVACNGEAKEQPATATTTPVEAAKPEEIKIKKAPVNINESGASDYPEIVRNLGFPMLPGAEVVNVGNAVIDKDGLVMRINAKDDLESTIAYYDKEMLANGWEKKEMKIFQGADKALRYEKDKIVCRIIMIGETDYTKVMVNMTPKINPADYEDR